MEYFIRKSADTDRNAIAAIFNFFVEASFAAYFEDKVGSNFLSKLKELASGFPVYVIETEQKKIIGFGLLHCYFPGKVFRHTAELTYFILPEYTRRGLGERMLNTLSEDAREMGVQTLLANIASANEASLNFHKKHGFIECGRFRRVGNKFGKYFDIIWMQKNL